MYPNYTDEKIIFNIPRNVLADYEKRKRKTWKVSTRVFFPHNYFLESVYLSPASFLPVRNPRCHGEVVRLPQAAILFSDCEPSNASKRQTQGQ